MAGDQSTLEQFRSAEKHPAEQERAISKSWLQQRRGELLSDLAAHLLSGQDLDREVMPALYVALARDRARRARLREVAISD